MIRKSVIAVASLALSLSVSGLASIPAHASVPGNGWYSCATGDPVAYGLPGIFKIYNGAVMDGQNCAGATKIPEGATSIANYAFNGATTLTSIIIPEGVISIGEGAFINTAITSISTPSSLTSIGKNAFKNATSLASVTIAEGVTSIGSDTFSTTPSLTAITVNSNNESFSSINSVLLNKDATTLIKYPAGRAETSYAIPEGVTSIGDLAFAAATGLTTITIPENVASIGDSAFYGASGLSSISIPASVTSIGEYAFEGTTALSSITFAQGSQLISIGDAAFAAATGLTSITIPTSVTSIGSGAFYLATSLTSITIPDSVDTIGAWVFEDTDALIDFNFLGDAPTYVDEDAFTAIANGAIAHIKASAEGFGAPGDPWTWNGLIVQADMKEVIYNSAGGTPVASYFFTQSGLIQTAPVSTLVGYTLSGWSDTANGSVVTFPYTPTANVTLHAIWISNNVVATPTITTWPTASTIVSGQSLSDATLSGGLASVPGSFAFAEPNTTPPVGSASHQVVFTPTDTTNYTTVTSSVEVTVTEPTSTPEPTPSASVTPTASPAKTAITSSAAKFTSGSSVLTKSGKKAIKKIVNKAGKDAEYIVTGIASKSTGVPNSNVKALAKARAAKVKAYLIKLGVKKSNITVKIKIVDSGVIPKTKTLAKYLTK